MGHRLRAVVHNQRSQKLITSKYSSSCNSIYRIDNISIMLKTTRKTATIDQKMLYTITYALNTNNKQSRKLSKSSNICQGWNSFWTPPHYMKSSQVNLSHGPIISADCYSYPMHDPVGGVVMQIAMFQNKISRNSSIQKCPPWQRCLCRRWSWKMCITYIKRAITFSKQNQWCVLRTYLSTGDVPVHHQIQYNDKARLSNLHAFPYISTSWTVANITIDTTTLHGTALTHMIQMLSYSILVCQTAWMLATLV